MKLQVCAIKDRALNAFMQPFFAQTTGAAIRAFQDGVNDGTTPMNKHPDDYDLWWLAEWDDQTGMFVANPDDRSELPQQLALGKNLVQNK